MSQSLKDVLRKVTVGAAKKFKKVKFEYEGNTFEFRSLTVRERDEIREKATDGKGNIQGAVFQVWAIIYMTYVPDTDEKVFEEGDYESLMSQPAGGFVDALASEALKLLGGDDEGKPKG